ncbi:uncharacterized protein LOC121393056 isoform X3 [Xenopus laevis]|uniref:Uncharacterized protein LOC121393056 isoform X3 n=1 Tax=Xenopus laevis TaxID=8355 RepID=A0A8J1MHW9_XENLA|nr:uncharacterized protein LOC121393056 isoform X3 [Xenopus laevis]XP_041441318.1 uncharacterized protein LOC121393056 isoform X3 [Xenopus laevis]XP_041441319.1 uncharacterized protein LOC121393056 isoform X3 [Xenopus laevis]XP_041441320.1 uncharacterized protein LOC121393056 isoform X3 [Xenopus laevis]XP_041441321.1 uncharacterized protein LOC121393056 isoform X3 [Xenopus laevis]XP_041441322.1 uncharacterized protein LOC121393056 isoform X3 [Xenopus laevis]XP_041441323.1 uncharacterized prot
MKGTLIVLVALAGAWAAPQGREPGSKRINDYDKPFSFQCPDQQSIDFIIRSCCRRKAQERKAESHIQEQPRNSSSRRNVSKRLEQFYRKVEQESHRDLEMLKHLKEQNLQVLRLAMVRKGTREQMDQQLRQTLFFPVSRSAKHWLYYKIWIQCLFVSSQQVVPPRAAGLKAWDAEFQRRPEPLDDILQPQHFNLVNESGVPLCGFT